MTHDDNLSENARIAKKELARRELSRRYYRYYLPYVHPGVWKTTRMSEYLANRIQEFVETKTGHSVDILIIQTPPQHGKSMTITESFPSWYLGKHPLNRVILVSYNDDTAKRFGRKNREKIEAYGPAVFGLKPGTIWTNNELELDNHHGTLLSRGVGAGITGHPADLMIIDDPIKNRAEAESVTTRDHIWAEWHDTLKTRLSAGGKIVVIATPWHEDDLMGRILASEPNVTLVRLPVEAEEDDPLGRKPGEPLAPELGKDARWLAETRQSYESDPSKGGLRTWHALWQCSPRVEGGNLINRSWWQYYDLGAIKTFATTIISVDATFKNGEDNDFVAIEVWSKLGVDYYLRYLSNKHLDFPGTLKEILQIRALFPDTMYVLIEDKANGSAIIQTLQSRMLGVIPVTPMGGKEARVNAIAPAIESGHVYVPNGMPWAEALIDQFTIFPAGKHDDMVDSASQALNFMIYRSGLPQLPPSQREAEEWEAAEREERMYLSSDQYDLYGDPEDPLLKMI